VEDDGFSAAVLDCDRFMRRFIAPKRAGRLSIAPWRGWVAEDRRFLRHPEANSRKLHIHCREINWLRSQSGVFKKSALGKRRETKLKARPE
jgi:hypothetical protein